MQWVVYAFGSGEVFFVGIGLILAGLAASFGKRRFWPRLSLILIIVGLIVAVHSSTPLPMWFYGVAILLTLGLRIVPALGERVSPFLKIGFCALVALVWLAGAAAEFPYHRIPRVPSAEFRRLYLIGDSLSAGLSEDQSHNWPELIAGAHNLELNNYARRGATVATALVRVQDAPLDDGVVLLEIGGNDILGTTSPQDFADDLRRLLQLVCRPGRQVVMFELPLPPLKNEFGRAQRELAAEFHVLLIPKRVLIGLITGEGTTVDSIHLSKRGHQQMAELIWPILESAYEP